MSAEGTQDDRPLFSAVNGNGSSPPPWPWQAARDRT